LKKEKRREDNQKELKRKKLEEQLNLLNEQLKTQSQIVEVYELYFNQNKISVEKLLEEKMKLLQLKTQIKQIEIELSEFK
jgi:outer membrane protein TolC